MLLSNSSPVLSHVLGLGINYFCIPFHVWVSLLLSLLAIIYVPVFTDLLPAVLSIKTKIFFLALTPKFPLLGIIG